MGIQKPGLLEQLIINGGLSFVPIQFHADRGFDITYGRQVGDVDMAEYIDGDVLSGRWNRGGRSPRGGHLHLQRTGRTHRSILYIIKHYIYLEDNTLYLIVDWQR